MGAISATRGDLLTGGIGIGGGILRLMKIPIGALTTGEKNTGKLLPTKGLVLDAWVQITTAETTGTTKTIDVGLLSSESGGDADGFLDGVATSATGVKRGAAVPTVGANLTYIGAQATHTLGALLSQVVAGADVADGPNGIFIPRPHILNGTARTVTYTLGSAHTELRGYIFVLVLALVK